MKEVNILDKKTYLQALSLPGVFPQRLALIGGTLLQGGIFLLDNYAGPSLGLSVLHIFPLAGMVLHATTALSVTLSFFIAAFFQIMTWYIAGAHTLNLFVQLGALWFTTTCAYLLRENYEVLVDSATTDALTGLLNRRAFEHEVEKEIERHRRHKSVFSIVLLDLDGFKALNDQHGHSKGDAALCIVADLLRERVRLSDSAARVGGDEFAILLTGTDSAHAEPFCQDLLEQLTLKTSLAQVGVSASIGCKTFSKTPDSVREALDLADQTMYRAKALGKRQVVCT